jgi:hypothetical protein
MGRSVNLWKLSETADEVEYAYGPDRQCAGLLAVSKATGAVRNIRSVAGYSEADSAFLFLQLAEAKAQMLQRSGSFPDQTALST